MIAILDQTQTTDVSIVLFEKNFSRPSIDWFIQQTDLNIISLSALPRPATCFSASPWTLIEMQILRLIQTYWIRSAGSPENWVWMSFLEILLHAKLWELLV